MFLVGLLQWWYGRGWKSQIARARDQFLGTAEFFSIGQLLGTLFAPFRQIAAAGVSGPIGVRLRAFADRLFSRLVGAFVRTCTILIGATILIVLLVIEVIVMIGWFLFPMLPVVGFIMFAIGWTP